MRILKTGKGLNSLLDPKCSRQLRKRFLVKAQGSSCLRLEQHGIPPRPLLPYPSPGREVKLLPRPSPRPQGVSASRPTQLLPFPRRRRNLRSPLGRAGPLPLNIKDFIQTNFPPRPKMVNVTPRMETALCFRPDLRMKLKS